MSLSTFKKRQGTPNSAGHRKSTCQILATVAMAKKQMRLDIIATAAAGPSM